MTQARSNPALFIALAKRSLARHLGIAARRNPSTTGFLPFSAILCALCVSALVFSSPSEAAEEQATPTVLDLKLDGEVEPILATYVDEGLADAGRRRAALVVISMDTPGGLSDSMKDIIQHILSSPVPVAVFVSPSGSRGASAGFYILLSADIAAMAPGTHTGAASPVLSVGGYPVAIDQTMRNKITNDAMAFLRSFTQKRGRNPTLAETAITDAKAFTEKEALDGKMIDLTATSEDDLLRQLNGREITRFDGSKVKLALSVPVRVEFQLSGRQKLLARIVAPDILHSEYFGWGMHARVYGYDSSDTQWSLVAGIKERVEREFVGAYQLGRTRETLWSFSTSLIYDVDGTPRFYGIGNHTHEIDESNYTSQESLGQVQIGLNITHRWQLQYTARLEVLDVLPGTLAHIDSIQTLFPGTLGTNKEILNRLSVVYDSRDDISIPTHGTQWVGYYGAAGADGIVSDGYFRETGTDGRVFWPLGPGAVLSTHLALRYLIDPHNVPFWALSSVGGSQSVIGGEQTLRGFGEGRFYDNDYFAASVELRRRFLTVDAVTTVLDLEVTPFIDLARVFSRRGEDPLESLHRVVGVGFRGVARPFVVGYVDVGYGSEGAAVFTGLNYPF